MTAMPLGTERAHPCVTVGKRGPNTLPALSRSPAWCRWDPLSHSLGWAHLKKGLGGLEGMLQVHGWPLDCINLGCLSLESCHCTQLFWVGSMMEVVCLGDCCFFCLSTSLCVYLGDFVRFFVSSSPSLSKHPDLQLSCFFTFSLNQLI